MNSKEKEISNQVRLGKITKKLKSTILSKRKNGEIRKEEFINYINEILVGNFDDNGDRMLGFIEEIGLLEKNITSHNSDRIVQQFKLDRGTMVETPLLLSSNILKTKYSTTNLNKKSMLELILISMQWSNNLKKHYFNQCCGILNLNKKRQSDSRNYYPPFFYEIKKSFPNPQEIREYIESGYSDESAKEKLNGIFQNSPATSMTNISIGNESTIDSFITSYYNYKLLSNMKIQLTQMALDESIEAGSGCKVFVRDDKNERNGNFNKVLSIQLPNYSEPFEVHCSELQLTDFERTRGITLDKSNEKCFFKTCIPLPLSQEQKNELDIYVEKEKSNIKGERDAR